MDKVETSPAMVFSHFREKLDLLEKVFSESLEQIPVNQQQSLAKLERYLDKLPLLPHQSRHIVKLFELEQGRVANNRQIVSELKLALEDLNRILASK